MSLNSRGTDQQKKARQPVTDEACTITLVCVFVYDSPLSKRATLGSL